MRPIKEFEATIDHVIGEKLKADGACGVELWSALVGIHWRAANGAVAPYTLRQATELVAWVREEGDSLRWYCSGPTGDVAPWIISVAMAAEGRGPGTQILFS